jgi:hypothetical protein
MFPMNLSTRGVNEVGAYVCPFEVNQIGFVGHREKEVHSQGVEANPPTVGWGLGLDNFGWQNCGHTHTAALAAARGR